ncbi:MAG: pantetheine-phosphate adenylyltransferase, partial [Candidatus Omnitrophica bacterium]|nr:pantetheine-phosphate adenylyltransferase [Candidatus Omnitrophota bacterium]
MCQRAIYPGTFDPITFGHLDLIKRARRIFSEVIVAVAIKPSKETLFNFKERFSLVKKVTEGIEGVTVEGFRGLIVDYAQKRDIRVLIRGLRMISDFEYEFQMALMNRRLKEKIEVIFLMPSESYSYISSKLLKEIASLGGDLSQFVPQCV